MNLQGISALSAEHPSPGTTVARIARAAGPPLLVIGLTTAGMVAALAAAPNMSGAIANAWLLSVGAVALWTLVRALGAALPHGGPSTFDGVRERQIDPPKPLADLVDIEAVILDAEWRRTGFEHELQPVLRRIASARLAEKYQIGIESEPISARRVLGEELWALVTPVSAGGASIEHSGPAPSDRSRRRRPRQTGRRAGIARQTIERAIELLEAL